MVEPSPRRDGSRHLFQLLSLLGGYQTKPYRVKDCLGAALHAQLRQNMLDVGLDGVLDNLQGLCDFLIRSPLHEVAQIPSITGMSRSISTTSGRSRCESSTASAPSDASPTTANSGSRPRNMRSPSRTTL